MRLKVLALLAVAGLAVAGVAAAVGAGWVKDPAQGLERILEGGHGHAMRGFHAVNGTVAGQWVRFTPDAANGTLAGFASRGPWAEAPLFERIALKPNPLAGAEPRGRLWGSLHGDLRIGVLDMPAAPFAVHNAGASPATVAFDAAPGVAVTALPNGTGARLAMDGHQAELRALGGATVNVTGSRVVATLPQDGAVTFGIPDYFPPHSGGAGPHGFGGHHGWRSAHGWGGHGWNGHHGWGEGGWHGAARGLAGMWHDALHALGLK